MGQCGDKGLNRQSVQRSLTDCLVKKDCLVKPLQTAIELEGWAIMAVFAGRGGFFAVQVLSRVGRREQFAGDGTGFEIRQLGTNPRIELGCFAG